MLTGLTLVAAAVGLSLVAAGYFSGNDTLFDIGVIILNIVTLVVTIVYAINMIQAMRLAVAGLQGLTAVKAALSAGRGMPALGVIGFAVGLGLTWGLFFFQMSGKSTIELNVMLAYAIAFTIILVVLLILDLIGFGLLTLIITIVDVILTLFGKTGVTQIIAEWLADLLYDVNLVIINLDDANRLDLDLGTVDLADPDAGFTVGNAITFNFEVTNTLRYSGKYNFDRADNTVFIYELERTERDYHDGLTFGQMDSEWQDLGNRYIQVHKDRDISLPLSTYGTGTNRAVNFYMTEAFAAQYEGCWFWDGWFGADGCTWEEIRQTTNIDLGSNMVYDVLPGTVSNFARMDWNSGSPPFPDQVDIDNDSLTDTDPYPTSVDGDGDGLTDLYEITNGLDPEAADGDGDGLNDAEELDYDTNPFLADSDGDLLNDRIEVVEGWLVPYNNGTQVARIWSDPNSQDADGDSLTDFDEFLFGFNPWVATDPSQIQNLVTFDNLGVNEVDGAELLLRFEETAAPANDLFVFDDSSGNGLEATCDNASGQCPLNGVDGRYGRALNFDGSDDQLNVAGVDITNRSFTISAWAQRENIGSASYILSQGTLQFNEGLQFGFLSNDRFLCSFYGSNQLISSAAYTDSDWHHWACTYDADTKRLELYRDGVNIGGTTTTVDYQGSGDLLIGQRFSATNYDFAGSIDEINIFDRAMTAGEIDDVMNGRYNPNDLLVAPGAELTYNATVTNTTSTNATGFLVPKTSYIEPEIGYPAVALGFEPEQKLTYFANEMGEQNQALCVDDGTCPTVGIDGALGSGVAFDGVDDVIQLPTVFNGNDFDTSANFGFWLWVDSLPTGTDVAMIFDSASTQDGALDLYLNAGGNIIYDIAGGEMVTSTYSFSGNLGRWVHVMINSNDLYINGDEPSKQSVFTSGVRVDQLGYGTMGNSIDGRSPLHGKIDELVYYDFTVEDGSGGGISYNEITTHVMTGDYYFNPDDLPNYLLKLEELNSYDGTIFYDSQANSNHATCSGNGCPILTDSTGGAVGRAATFDGVDDRLTQPGSYTTPGNNTNNEGETSLTLWVNIDQYPSAGNQAYILDSTSSGDVLDLYINSDGKFVASREEGTHTSSGAVPLNQWVKIHLYYDIFLESGNYHYNSFLEFDDVYDSDRNYRLGSSTHPWDVNLTIGPGYIGNDASNSSPFSGGLDEMSLSGLATIDFDPPSANLGFENLANTLRTATCDDIFVCPSEVTGQYGQAVGLDGDDDHLLLGEVDFAQGDYTIGVWFNSSASGASQTILAAVSETSNHGVLLELQSDGRLRYLHRFPSGTSGGSNIFSGSAYNDGAWHYATAVRQGSSMTLYVDGVEIGTATAAQNAPEALEVVIGQLAPTNDNRSFNGFIDELLIIPSAVTDAGVAHLMNSEFPVLNVPDLFTGFSAGPLSTLDVAGTASINEFTTASVHQFDLEVEAALELQTNIDYPVVDDNAANLDMFFPFEETPGSTQFDNLISTDEATCSDPACPTAGLRGQVGRALYFDGNDDFLTARLNATSVGYDTIAFWANGKNGTFLSISSVEIDFNRIKNSSTDDTVPLTLPIDEWFHIAIVDGSSNSVDIYLNGQWVDNKTIRFGGSGSGEIYLGANFDGQDQYNGFLDDLRFYDKSLTAAEVLTLYEESAPLMRLEFDEESDATVFLDNSVNGFVGVPDSTTYFDATLNQTVTRYSPLPGTDGKIGNTALFEADGFVEVAEASSAINLIDDFSIMLWLKTTETDVGLFGKTDGDSSWELGEKMFYLDSNGYPTFVGWGNNFIRSSTAVNDDVWHHIAVTWDAAAGTGTIVIDGVDATTGDNYAANNADNSGDTIKIGAPNYFSSEAPNFFSGEIDELAVYGRALPEAELFSIYLREYRWYRDHSDNIVIVDTDAPTIELLSDLGYRQNGYIQLAVATRDVTSRVTLLDFGLKGPGDSSFTWQGANVCAEAIATNAAWCPYVDTSVLDGAGEYEIQFRAVDAVGNETTSPVYTIYVDGEAPSTTSGTYNSAWLPLIPDPTQELSWTVFLAGTITDPVIPGGQDGSGPITRTTTLTLINAAGAIVGNGQPQPVNVTAATVSSFDWSVNYQFIGQRPTGVYTLTLQTEDAVGNQADLVIDTIRLDGRAPSATYNHWEMASNGITETVTLSGVVVEQPDWGSTVAEFHMESAWYDSSGEDNHASCTSCPTAVSGLFGAAADFAGTDALSVPAAESLNLEADLTIAAWINPDIAAGSVLTLGSDKAVLGLNASSQLYFTVTVDGTPRTITAPDGMGTGAWRHIAGTYDGVTMRLYQDGVELDTLAITGSVDASSGLTIGSAFDGRIDEIFVYGRALTAAEIYATGQREVRGVQAVELWIEEIFFDGSTDSENWQTAAVSGGEWTLDVPDGLEGFFDIHLRSRDLNGNQAYEGIIWRGSIDTADPRISFSGQHGGGGSAAYTEYTFDFADIVLDPGSFNHPCTPDTLEETVYTGTNTPLDGQLYQAGMTCRVAGHQTGTIPAGTCDFVGHCTTETVSLSSPANLASVSILSPEPGRTMTLTQPISITGGAYAPAGIEDLIIRVDTSEVGAYAFGGSETDTGWSTSWWPTLPGTYTITAVMTDTLNSVYTDTIQVTLVGNLMFTTVDGSGIGTVNSDPTGISCGTACMATWPTGSVITLTAVPDISSHFAGWSGACSGTGSCVVTLNSTERVTATFDINEYDLTVTPVGDGSGTVNSSPAGIDCGVDCSETLTHGTVMTLTAVPDAGSIFNGWGGSCSGNDECVVTMLGSTAVTAEFLDDSNVGVSVTPVTLAVAEGGITDTYTIALNTNPTDPVTITLATDGQIEPIAPLVLTDTGPVTVTVTAVDDSLVEGNHLSTIAHSTASVDLYYDGITVQNIEIDVTDNDIEYALTAAITETAELDLGSSTPLTFTLSRTGDISRTSQVDFDLLGSSAALGIDFNNVRVSGTGIVENNGTITFTDGITQAMILLDVIGDDIDESDETIKIALSSPAGTNATGVGLLANSPTSITIIDDDSRGVLVLGAESGLTVSEGGMTDTYTIQLTSEPTATVTLEIGVDNGEVDLGAGAGQPISLTFTTADWMNPQTVTATAIDDLSAEPTHNSVLSHTVRGGDYGSLTPANIIVTILDDDVPNVTLTPPGLVITETGVTTATFVMTLDSLPTEPVTVTLTSDDVSECTVAPGVVVLTPANWNTGLPVTVTSVDENIDDADQLCTIVTSNASSSDADYSDLAVDDLPVTVIDDDGLPSINFATTAITTTEGSIDLLVTLGLSNPSAFTVTVDVDSANHGAEAGLDYTAVSETVSFTPLATTAAFIVPIMDDNIDEPTEMVTLTVSNPAMGIIGLLNEASVIIEDNDAPSVITVADSSASETDLVGSIAFTVSLNVASAYPISVSYQTADGTALAGQHYTETIGVLNFAPGETEKWVTVPIIGNDEDGPNQTFELVLSGPTNASIGDNTAVGTILDDDFTLVYLPIALQNYPLGPDLIVESLAVAGATIEVTIRNSGDAPVTDAFWVDVYVDPDVPPTAVNQTIDTLGSRGAVWGVSSSALPLMPGESLTLVLNDPYFDAAVSRLSLPVQPGSAVYAQVDSAHPDTSYGGVLESHERLDEPYNNIIQEISK
ncbi:MAG: Calx-beta domain-containing protein [Ardenticatenaceae bacterium]|nr:Calx-beta domain-containing protein [Ardenticatenaceae bacterium]